MKNIFNKQHHNSSYYRSINERKIKLSTAQVIAVTGETKNQKYICATSREEVNENSKNSIFFLRYNLSSDIADYNGKTEKIFVVFHSLLYFFTHLFTSFYSRTNLQFFLFICLLTRRCNRSSIGYHNQKLII